MKRIIAFMTAIILFIGLIPLSASAASYPLVVLMSTESTPTIVTGQKGTLRFMILPEYHNEKLKVQIYNSSGGLVGSASKQYYNSDGTFSQYINIGVDTADLDLSVGKYKVVYWMEFYTMYAWHSAPSKYQGSFEVIKNTCRGNHNLKLVRTVTEATCEKEGRAEYKCSTCGHIVYNTIPKAHNFGFWTHYNAAYHKKTCKNCSYFETQAHTFGAGTVTKEPTCAETGIMTYTCSTCKGNKNEAIPTTDDHVYGNWKYHNENSHIHNCEKCNKAETSAHQWDNGEITQLPNCSQQGIKTYTCTVCGGQKDEPVPTTDDHQFGAWEKHDQAYHKRKCVLCDKIVYESHDWDEGRVTQNPTCAAAGTRTYTCTLCDAEKNESIPKGEAYHEFGAWMRDDDETHSHFCQICSRFESRAHCWGSYYWIQYPTEYQTGILQYQCDECNAYKNVEVDYSPGDVNGDGFVDNEDVTYLLWHTLFTEDYPIYGYADFENDGIINNKDVEYLLWHTLFPEDYPLG